MCSTDLLDYLARSFVCSDMATSSLQTEPAIESAVSKAKDDNHLEKAPCSSNSVLQIVNPEYSGLESSWKIDECQQFGTADAVALDLSVLMTRAGMPPVFSGDSTPSCSVKPGQSLKKL